jgi:hypothetical protein
MLRKAGDGGEGKIHQHLFKGFLMLIVTAVIAGGIGGSNNGRSGSNQLISRPYERLV